MDTEIQIYGRDGDDWLITMGTNSTVSYLTKTKLTTSPIVKPTKLFLASATRRHMDATNACRPALKVTCSIAKRWQTT